MDLLDTREATEHWKAAGLDLAPVLVMAESESGLPAGRRCTTTQDHGLERALDHQFLELCRPAIESGERVEATLRISNVDRTVGTLLGYEITRLHGAAGLAGRHDLAHVHGFGGPELRGVRSEGRDDASRRGRERLSRQGTLRGTRDRAAARGLAVSLPRSRSSPATSSSTAPRPERCFSEDRWARGSACATRVPPPSSKGSVTTPAST